MNFFHTVTFFSQAYPLSKPLGLVDDQDEDEDDSFDLEASLKIPSHPQRNTDRKQRWERGNRIRALEWKGSHYVPIQFKSYP